MENLNQKEEDTKKDVSKKTLLSIFLVILFLSFATYYNFKNWRETLSKIELPKFEMPQFEPFPKKEGYKEWTSPDEKLKMTYPADWIEMDVRTLESYIQREIEEKPLFVAQKILLEKSTFAFLTINKLKLEEGLNLEEIIEKMKEDAQKREGKMEILKLEIKNGKAIFEARYSKVEGPVFHSKEKMILKEEVYLISFFTFEKDFSEFQKEAEEIIDSTQLVE